jgi:hypothetical protein
MSGESLIVHYPIGLSILWDLPAPLTTTQTKLRFNKALNNSIFGDKVIQTYSCEWNETSGFIFRIRLTEGKTHLDLSSEIQAILSKIPIKFPD